jgi:Macrocin-O-methyltransferase (TylF).
MKRVLTNFIYEDDNAGMGHPPRFDSYLRENGMDWPSQAHTMVGLKRLNNIQHCAEAVLRDGVPGDFVEAGVWRGGATILMRAILKAYGVTDRRVWVADSFQGLARPRRNALPARRR